VSEGDDIVYVRDLVFEAIIGVLPDERTTPQPVCINLEVSVDTQTAADSQRLDDTLDYAVLAEKIRDYTVGAKCLLVETLAENIAALTLVHPQARAVTVDVMKPNALEDARGVGVRIHRVKTSR